MTDLEIQSNPENFGVKKELKDLETQISRDYEKFKNLTNNTSLKKGMEKIYDKNCKLIFSEERKHFEKLNIGGTIQKILKRYPDLLIYITGDLGLSLKEAKFSKLSTEQKFNFTALYQAVNGSSLIDKKHPNSSDISKRIKRNININTGKISEKFKWKNITNFLQLEKTLQEDYGLTSIESKKVKDYLEIIKKHPEYINDVMIQKAGIGSGGWMLIGITVGLILGALGMNFIDNIGKVNPETTNTIGETVIEEPEAILYLLTQKFHFSTNGSIKKKLFTESEEDTIIELGKNLLKRGINLFQTKELTMEMIGDLALKYDLDGSSLIVNHTTGEVTLKVKRPDIIIIDSDAEITNTNGEVFEMQTFRNAEMELEKQLKDQAIKEAKDNPHFYEEAKRQTEEDLEILFKEIKPYGISITKVRVEYIDYLEVRRD